MVKHTGLGNIFLRILLRLLLATLRGPGRLPEAFQGPQSPPRCLSGGSQNATEPLQGTRKPPSRLPGAVRPADGPDRPTADPPAAHPCVALGFVG